jgi:5-methylcytosine-specific restriction endonuclease McrA
MTKFTCKKCGSNRSPKNLSQTKCATCLNARSRRRRQRKMHAQGTHTPEQTWDLYINQRASCGYCGVHIPFWGPLSHLDHMIPLSKGGLNSIANMVWACASCDEDKSNWLLWEWPARPWAS